MKKDLKIIAEEIIQKTKNHFGNKTKEFQILNFYDIPGNESFDIIFSAYNYYVVRISYDNERLGCCILNGQIGLEIENSQKWYNSVNYDTFMLELQEGLELRIPDKFLIKKGWKN